MQPSHSPGLPAMFFLMRATSAFGWGGVCPKKLQHLRVHRQKKPNPLSSTDSTCDISARPERQSTDIALSRVMCIPVAIGNMWGKCHKQDCRSSKIKLGPWQMVSAADVWFCQASLAPSDNQELSTEAQSWCLPKKSQEML